MINYQQKDKYVSCNELAKIFSRDYEFNVTEEDIHCLVDPYCRKKGGEVYDNHKMYKAKSGDYMYNTKFIWSLRCMGDRAVKFVEKVRNLQKRKTENKTNEKKEMDVFDLITENVIRLLENNEDIICNNDSMPFIKPFDGVRRFTGHIRNAYTNFTKNHKMYENVYFFTDEHCEIHWFNWDADNHSLENLVDVPIEIEGRYSVKLNSNRKHNCYIFLDNVKIIRKL